MRNTPHCDAVNVFGKAGAGKGTVFTGIEKTLESVDLLYNPRLEVGKFVRAQAKTNTEMGREMRRRMNAGELVGDDLIIPAIANMMRESRRDALLLLDGFPRNDAQIQPYLELMEELDRNDYGVYLDVPTDVCVQRLLSRGQEALERGEEVRDDDLNEEIIAARLKNIHLDGVLESFDRRGKLITIDTKKGKMSPDEVQAVVRSRLLVPLMGIEESVLEESVRQ